MNEQYEQAHAWRRRTMSQFRRELADVVEDAARAGVPTVVTRAVTHPNPRQSERERAVVVPAWWFEQQDHTGLRPGPGDET